MQELVAYALEAIEQRPTTGTRATIPKDSPKRSSHDEPDNLTQREHTVAGLLRRGLINREIVQELVIRRRTVEVHVKHILAKLGVTSRVQVAAWVFRQRWPDRAGPEIPGPPMPNT